MQIAALLEYQSFSCVLQKEEKGNYRNTFHLGTEFEVVPTYIPLLLYISYPYYEPCGVSSSSFEGHLQPLTVHVGKELVDHFPSIPVHYSKQISVQPRTGRWREQQ